MHKLFFKKLKRLKGQALPESLNENDSYLQYHMSEKTMQQIF
jgi:hypothetical protein